MHAIQAFLMTVFSGLVLLTALILLGKALAVEEVTIYDRAWRVRERIKDGTIYDKDWNMRKRIKNGKIYDRNWNLKERIGNEIIFDRNWNAMGYTRREINRQRRFDYGSN